MPNGPTRELEERLRAPRIGVLGPVALGPPTEMVPIAARPARALLALAGARGPRGLDLLSEVVWGEDRPATYRAALHVHLGALRRALAAVDPSGRIERQGDGYVLELGEWELDSTLAADLLAAASRALESDPVAALGQVERALELWRGVPYSVGGEIVDAGCSNELEMLHRDAEDLHIETLLQLGELGRAETAALAGVRDDPLRENRWGQLLRARYLAGRTADALATYQAARRALIEAVGVEPGQDLRDLEAAALTHDVTRLRVAPSAPDQVLAPPRTGGLIGRDAVLRRVTTIVLDAGRLAILGPPGVGKSSVAAEVANDLAPGRAAWIDLRTHGSREVGASVRVLLDWVHRHPDGVIVLDNAEAAMAEARSAVEELSRRAPSVRVLVTSCAPLDLDLAVEILEPLELPDIEQGDDAIEAATAVQALRAAMRELAPAATLSSLQAGVLSTRAGGLPLTLRLVAAAARALPVDAMLQRPPSMTGDPIDLAVRAVLELVRPDALEAFAALSSLRGDFDAQLGGDIAGLSGDRLHAVLVELVDHGLVQAHPHWPLPYAMLEPIRAVADRLLDESGRRHEVVERQIDACLLRARALQTSPFDGDVSGLEARVTTEISQARDALRHLASTGDAERALALVCHLETPLYTLGWWVEKTELFDSALAIDGPASAMRARAHVFRSRPGPLHLFDLEHAEAAERMADQLGHVTLGALARMYRSLHLWWCGRPSDAVALASAAAEEFERAGRTFEWCEAYKFLGVALVLDGQSDAGLDAQRDALEVVRSDLRSPFHIAHNLAYLGHCHRFLGDDTAALADWTEARELTRHVGNRGTAIHIGIGLGEVAADRGDASALPSVAEALDLIDAARAWTYAPWAWTVAMRAHAQAGDLESAVASARRAVHGLTSAPSGEALRLAIELAALALDMGDARVAGRLLGVAAGTADLRELPFPSPAEAARRVALTLSVSEALGDDAEPQMAAGRRCSVSEAAGELLFS